MSKHNIRLVGNNTELDKWKQNDTLIMKDIIKNPGMTYEQEAIQAINRCRIYLQVTTVSDITEARGNRILRSVWECQRDFTATSSKAYKWLAQQRPGPTSIAYWQQALKDTYGIQGNNLKTTKSLGQWKPAAYQWKEWVYQESTDSLYQFNLGRWIRWRKLINRRRTEEYTSTHEINYQRPRGSTI